MTTATLLPFAEVDVPATRALQVMGECGPGHGAISTAMEECFTALMAFARAHGVTPAGPPRAIYTTMGSDGMAFVVALPIAEDAAVDLDDRVFADVLPGVHAMCFTHVGPYAELSRTYAEIESTLRVRGLLSTERDWARFMPMWEEYLGDPATTPPSELVTHIYLPMAA